MLPCTLPSFHLDVLRLTASDISKKAETCIADKALATKAEPDDGDKVAGKVILSSFKDSR